MDKVLYMNSFAFAGLGAAALVIPSRLGWTFYHNEGCKYFQFHTRIIGVSALSLATLNLSLSRHTTPKSVKSIVSQVMLGVNVGAVVLTASNFSLFLPLVGSVAIGVNLLLAGFNGYYGFLAERADQI